MPDTDAMHKRERFRFVAVIGLVLALLSAGFALAGDVFDDPDEPVVCEPIDDVIEEGESEEGESEEDCEEGDDEGDTDDAAGDGEEGDVLDDVEPALEVSEERVAECTEAAGLTEDAPEAKPVPGDKTGLENAIAHVLWNCLRNDNDGLVNALEHLQANLLRKLDREELKAERRAEREAAKAEREASQAERKAAHEAAKAARELTRSS